MKKVLFLSLILSNILIPQKSWIRINQLGYLEKSFKTAVLLSKEKTQFKYFDICDALTDEIVLRLENIKQFNTYDVFAESYRLDFSDFQNPGAYYIKVGDIKSPDFLINNDVYEGTADLLLKYFRQQRCGFNPFINDSCHTKDGFVVYNPEANSTHLNAVGGWHTSFNYVKDASVSAANVFQLLFSFQQNTSSFKDEFDQNGNPWANGIPDILDEALWGIDWLQKMNPSSTTIYYQVGDDRQLNDFYLPNDDNTSYGKIPGRPVYYCTGKPQGFFHYKNKSMGLASIAGKFASAYALSSQLLRKYNPELSDHLKSKAFDSYNLGKKYPGVSQHIPGDLPNNYAEDNYEDDMELAATQLYKISNDKKFLDDAVKYANQETVIPWAGKDSIKMYQDYPVLNVGNYYLGIQKNKTFSQQGIDKFKVLMDGNYQNGKSNPFLVGIPFIKNSNYYIAASLICSKLYFELTGKTEYQETEAALRDWLFGCNPWGISMVTSFPEDGNYVKNPFSAIQLITKKRVEGGLVSGPVYSYIFTIQKNLKLLTKDKFADFQPSGIVYHDDCDDFLTNEPSLDGTASLIYYLASMQMEGSKYYTPKNYQYTDGAITRTDRTKKKIHLVFVGTEYANGGDYIRKVLKNQKIKAHFFFTGDFYRNAEFAPVVYNLKNDGQYLGALSDKNIHYTYIYNKDSVQIAKSEFKNDLQANYIEMGKFKIKKSDALLFMPPYQIHNKTLSNWTKELGLQMINFTTGIISLADTTLPDLPGYKSSDEIYKQILDYEKNNIDGLNGVILTFHIGYSHERTDKFFLKLDRLITELKKRGYSFTLIDN